MALSAGQVGETRQNGYFFNAEHRHLFSIFFANFIVFGAGAIVIGATVPKIIRDFSWDYLIMGAVLAAGSIGYFGSTFLCGVLIHKWGPKKVIVSTLVLQAIGLAFFGLHPNVATNLLAILLIGLGEGGTEVVTNFCVVRMEPAGQSRLMNLAHAAFPAGAIAASLGMGLLLEHGIAWQMMFRTLAVLCLLIAGALIFLSFSTMQPEPRRESSRATLLWLIRQPLLVLLALVVFFYIGAEIGVSNWISEYYVQILEAPLSVGASMVSVLWCGLLCGRLLVSVGYRSDRQTPLLFGLTCLATLSLGLALLMDTAWTAGLFFWGAGMGLSAIYPVVIVLVGQHFTREQGLAIGIVSTAGGVGSFLFPFVMSAIADHFSMIAGFWFYVAVSAVMTLCAALVLLRIGLGEK
ncbi:MAG: MFS transporter [Gemmatimonadetes bacterium]|jgi:fucose permease|nr:MFS transporter [Gemmatimonadota bacterium]